MVYDRSVAQTVLVRDNNSFRPVDNVAVYNPAHTHTALTNVYGIADLSSFRETDTLVFQHTAYETISYKYSEITAAEFNVYLQKKSISLDEIIISATRFEQDAEELPNRI
ncbi:MAG: hypothetical protein DRI83_12820, partial [Bacteroidetes bacterium]